MIDVIVVSEGQTEERFVERCLAPFFVEHGVRLEPRLIATSRVAKGGALSRERVLRALRNTLRERGTTYVTTFFDLYGLTSDFPGVREFSAVRDPLERARRIEQALQSQAIEVAERREDRFFSHIQPHEFEALVFSDVESIVAVRSEWRPFLGQLQRVRDEALSPEHINDGPETHPSQRLQRLLRPKFEKVLDGIRIVERIGVDGLRSQCKHFDAWVSHIEALTPLSGGG
ncbi:MAG: DUF4276 family protein [Thermoanaerobaculia bacterium]|jgi:hypothetical protein